MKLFLLKLVLLVPLKLNAIKLVANEDGKSLAFHKSMTLCFSSALSVATFSSMIETLEVDNFYMVKS